jgi:hypothetical protein
VQPSGFHADFDTVLSDEHNLANGEIVLGILPELYITIEDQIGTRGFWHG